METYLKDFNIKLLKSMFRDEALYLKHMETLYGLRDLAIKAIEKEDGSFDKSSPYYRLFEFSNELFGALNDRTTHFEICKDGIKHYKLNKDERF